MFNLNDLQKDADKVLKDTLILSKNAIKNLDNVSVIIGKINNSTKKLVETENKITDCFKKIEKSIDGISNAMVK
jgi:hypothetical protein